MELHITGMTVLIDDEDEQLLTGYSWTVDHRGAISYVRGTPKGVGAAKAKKVYMHRVILGMPTGLVDHINMNGLDNRRCNIRVVTKSENCLNRRKLSNNTSGVKGCYFSKALRKWYAKVTINGKGHKRGYFSTVEEAASEYADLVYSLVGNTARTDSSVPIGSNPS